MTHFLIRHFEPDWSLVSQHSLRGHGADLVPLTDAGMAQVDSTVDKLSEFSLKQIVSSPMTRCLQTAALLSRALDIPMEVQFRLHEWIPDLSMHWSSYDFVQMAEREREQCAGEWPEGETRCWEPVSQVRKRALAVIHQYPVEEKTLFVTHSLVIQSLTGLDLRYGDICPIEAPLDV